MQTADKWTVMWSSHLKVRLIRVRCKEREGEGEDPATLALKLITDAVVNTLGAMLAEVRRDHCSDCNDSTCSVLC